MSSPTSRRGTRAASLLLITLGGVAAATAMAIAIPAFASTAGPSEFFGPTAVPTAEDGALPNGVSVFDDSPAVRNLDPALLAAVQRAAADAEAEGIDVVISSGWRSPELQESLLRDAVLDHGSEEEAARWVATAETSAHVSGSAVDIGYTDAMYWFARFGEDYGLCQIYANEPWHYELHPEAPAEGCPAQYSDPTEDPRMQHG